jgi:fructuronate reductase
MAVTTTPLLGLDTLSRLPAPSRPLVRPGDVGAGILHLGLGAFFRAHQAVYTEEAIAAAGGDWGIIGVAPRSAQVIADLEAQDRLFSVTTMSGATAGTRVVGALAGVRHAAADPAAVVALLAEPTVRVVTLTVTEKGYRLDPSTGRLTVDDDLRADLTTARAPVTIPGLLLRGLLARFRAGAAPVAVLSCDNLPANGRRMQSLVEQACALVPGDTTAFGEWLGASVTFPGSMVDRIVPASTPETLELAATALGARDLAGVHGEPYRQWVIEDRFPGGRPAWESAGVVLTDDAGPWERLKLRALNGVHSAIAYLGALAGRETIAEALRIPGMRAAMTRFIAEDVAGSFTPPPGVSVVGYGESVLNRFTDPAIAHRTRQIAMDGSQKLPQRVLHTIQDRRAAGASPRWAALAVAAWIRYAQGVADDGRTLTLDDPLAARIHELLAAAGSTPEAVVDALFSLDTVFPAELAADGTVRALVVEWLSALDKHGVEATLAGAA